MVPSSSGGGEGGGGWGVGSEREEYLMSLNDLQHVVLTQLYNHDCACSQNIVLSSCLVFSMPNGASQLAPA